jgi:hypothetical protein
MYIYESKCIFSFIYYTYMYIYIYISINTYIYIYGYISIHPGYKGGGVFDGCGATVVMRLRAHLYGPSIRQICARLSVAMTNMSQVCSSVHFAGYLLYLRADLYPPRLCLRHYRGSPAVRSNRWLDQTSTFRIKMKRVSRSNSLAMKFTA